MAKLPISRIAPAGQLLRTGGSVAPIAPDAVANLFAWYKADTLTGTNGSLISTWADSSDAARDLTATTGNEPTLVTAGLNGLNVVDFDPSIAAQYMTSAEFALNAQTHTVFVVARSDVVNDNNIFFDGNGSTQRAIYNGPNGEFRTYAGAVLNSGTFATAGAWCTAHRRVRWRQLFHACQCWPQCRGQGNDSVDAIRLWCPLRRHPAHGRTLCRGRRQGIRVNIQHTEGWAIGTRRLEHPTKV